MTALRASAPGSGIDLGGFTIVRELGARIPPVFVAQRAREGGATEIAVVEWLGRAEESADAAAAFVRVGKRIATLAHPNLVRVRDAEVRAGEVLLVSEFIDAERYDEVTAAARANKPMPLVVHLRVIVDVLGGMSALHLLADARKEALSLVHREACPANVLLGLDGNARLSHPCRAPGSKPSREALGYVAPEVRLGDKAVDARADVYSAGVMLWEALAGERLFSDESGAKLLQRQVAEKIPAPRLADDAAWARPLVDVAMRAMAADPAARYATAADMAADVRKVAAAKLAMKSTLAAVVKDASGERIAARRREVSVQKASSPSGVVKGAPAGRGRDDSGEILVRERERNSQTRVSVPTPAMAIPRHVLQAARADAFEAVTAKVPPAQPLAKKAPPPPPRKPTAERQAPVDSAIVEIPVDLMDAETVETKAAVPIAHVAHAPIAPAAAHAPIAHAAHAPVAPVLQPSSAPAARAPLPVAPEPVASPPAPEPPAGAPAGAPSALPVAPASALAEPLDAPVAAPLFDDAPVAPRRTRARAVVIAVVALMIALLAAAAVRRVTSGAHDDAPAGQRATATTPTIVRAPATAAATIPAPAAVAPAPAPAPAPTNEPTPPAAATAATSEPAHAASAAPPPQTAPAATTAASATRPPPLPSSIRPKNAYDPLGI